MSDSQAYEEVAVDSDGVFVTKRYEKDDFPVPAIAFHFQSRRDADVTVTLWDDVPEDVEVEDLGFHPEYGSDFWEIEDDEIKLEREFESGEEYTTVYGIRATGTDNIDQFLTTPTLEVDPPTMDEEDLAGSGDAVEDVISGDSDEVPGLEDEEDEDVDTLDLNDPNDPGGDAAEADGEADASADAGTGGSTQADDGTALSVDGDSLVGAMANELRENDVSKEDVKLLRKAFDLAAEDQGSVRAKVDKLQQDVSDVVAYTDALEAFLDENGTAGEISEFEDRFEEVRAELESVESQVESQSGEIDDLSGTVSDVEDDVGGMEDTVEELDDDIDEFEAQIEGIESDLEDVREKVGSTDIDEEIENIEAEIEQLKEWREQLSSVIGGGE
jgi:archaellum component FlaC